jgi:hypothetical protein
MIPSLLHPFSKSGSPDNHEKDTSPFFKGGNPFTGSSNKSAGNWCHWPTKPFDLTDQPMQAPQLSYLTENSIPTNDKQ